MKKNIIYFSVGAALLYFFTKGKKSVSDVTENIEKYNVESPGLESPGLLRPTKVIKKTESIDPNDIEPKINVFFKS